MNIEVGTKLKVSFGMPYRQSTGDGCHVVELAVTVTEVHRTMFRYEVDSLISESGAPTEFEPQRPVAGFVGLNAESLKANGVEPLA